MAVTTYTPTSNKIIVGNIGDWEFPERAYVDNGLYAHCTIEDTTHEWGTFNIADLGLILKVELGIEAWGSIGTEFKRWINVNETLFPLSDLVLTTLGGGDDLTWVNITNITDWTVAKLQAIAVRLQHIGDTLSSYLDVIFIRVTTTEDFIPRGAKSSYVNTVAKATGATAVIGFSERFSSAFNRTIARGRGESKAVSQENIAKGNVGIIDGFEEGFEEGFECSIAHGKAEAESQKFKARKVTQV